MGSQELMSRTSARLLEWVEGREHSPAVGFATGDRSPNVVRVVSEPVSTIACDESGAEGENLTGAAHRVFAHTSHDLP